MLRLLGLLVLLLTSSQIARVATVYGNETDVIDLLSTGRIRTSATWCYKKPGPERCAATLHIKDGVLLLEGVGCGTFRVPVNGSDGRYTAKISGSTIEVSVAGKNGTGVNTYELSADLRQCSHTVQCPAGFQAKVFSCSVERSSPAIAQQGSSAKADLKQDETGPLMPSASAPAPATKSQAPPVDAQSFLDAARDLKERDPTYNSLLAAVQTFRRAAAAFGAAGDVARVRAAIDEAEGLENDIKVAERRVGLKEDQNQCGMLRGNALQCYVRSARFQPSPSSEPLRVGQVGAFLDCVKNYCSAMQQANCPMPLFGQENAGFCFTTATDNPDPVQQEGSGAKPQPARTGKGARR